MSEFAILTLQRVQVEARTHGRRLCPRTYMISPRWTQHCSFPHIQASWSQLSVDSLLPHLASSQTLRESLNMLCAAWGYHGSSQAFLACGSCASIPLCRVQPPSMTLSFSHLGRARPAFGRPASDQHAHPASTIPLGWKAASMTHRAPVPRLVTVSFNSADRV